MAVTNKRKSRSLSELQQAHAYHKAMSQLVRDTLTNSLKGCQKGNKNSIAYTTKQAPNNSEYWQ
jgi:hypothetical protein